MDRPGPLKDVARRPSRERARFTPRTGADTHWVEHLRSDHLSVGTYSLAPAGDDDQVPHLEDEVYVVTSGRARLSTPSGPLPVETGDAVFVPAGEPHTFTDVTGDFAVLVLFAPPESEPCLTGLSERAFVAGLRGAPGVPSAPGAAGGSGA